LALQGLRSPSELQPSPAQDKRDVLVPVSATNGSGGGLDLFQLVASVYVIGARNASYQGGCPVPNREHLLDYVALDQNMRKTVHPGQTVTGFLCFRIAASDADSLVLFTLPPLERWGDQSGYPPPPGARTVWFALR